MPLIVPRYRQRTLIAVEGLKRAIGDNLEWRCFKQSINRIS